LAFVITDSGGLQEETTYLGIPCLTLRPNTERPITLKQGTNRFCRVENLENHVKKFLKNPEMNPKIPKFWDGQTANRIIDSIHRFLFNYKNFS